MEHAQIQTAEGTPVMINGQQLQVLQMNNTPHMIQSPNGQIIVHAIPSNTPIQVATPNGQQLQQVQVVPLSNLQGSAAPMQLVQTADGQTFLYQPAAPQQTIDHQIVHQPTVLNINGNLVQVATSVNGAVQQPQIVGQSASVVVESGEASSAGDSGAAGSADEEPLLYVNARQYKRILKRRAARARLHELGKIPKERPRYLHESRHRHAMNRIRGEGGRFHSGSRKNMKEEPDEADKQEGDEVKPETVSITIIQKDDLQQQWRRLAPMQSA